MSEANHARAEATNSILAKARAIGANLSQQGVEHQRGHVSRANLGTLQAAQTPKVQDERPTSNRRERALPAEEAAKQQQARAAGRGQEQAARAADRQQAKEDSANTRDAQQATLRARHQQQDRGGRGR